MAVIWSRKNGFKVYVTPEGTPPSREEMTLAEEYDRELRKRVEKIRRVLLRKGFLKRKIKLRNGICWERSCSF